MKKVLFSDFDRTLFVEDEEVLDKNIAAINKFMKDNIFVIITGRTYKSVKRVLDLYNIKYNYLICMNGAEIYEGDKLLLKICLHKEDVDIIKDIIAKHHLDYSVDDFDDEKFADKEVSSVFIRRNEKLTYDAILETRTRTNTYNYLSPHWFNIVNGKVNKASAVEELKKIIGGDLKIYTIGDAVNDLEMIKNYNGVVMKDHEMSLDGLNLSEYEGLYQYIDKIIKED